MKLAGPIVAGLCCGLLLNPLDARELSQEALERWFESDELLAPLDPASNVNEGQLSFLEQRPSKAVHHHQNRLVISEHSLASGWVWLAQCHHNLDKVARLQITFKKGKVRDLHITSSQHIAESWVEDNTIQLRHVGGQAEVCITAWTRALINNQDGSYSMRNGPFMRKFLDGYYPMHVSMEINFSDTGLQLVSVAPKQQQGFVVMQERGRVSFDAWFEGRLKTEFRFEQARL